MFDITYSQSEGFNEETNEFVEGEVYKLRLEHSLVSLSKWESKYQVPFLAKTQKTVEQLLYYIKCMTLTQNVKEEAYLNMPTETIEEIFKYVESPQTATTFNDYTQVKGFGKEEIITSEIIYFWMFSAGIPKECEKWHLNRLLTLIKVFSIKNDSNPKKMSKTEILARNRALNAQRRKALGTKG